MQQGQWKVVSILEGDFLLDGGSMFGIVPKPLWSRRHPADSENRIVMALRTLLVIGPNRKILIDCGIGNRLSEKQQEFYHHRVSEGGLVARLRKLGIEPREITDVIASHLHFDHMGGMLTPTPAGLQPSFPEAKLHLQEDGWLWARAPSIWDQGSFFEQDFDIWERRIQLHLIRGDCEIAEGVRVKSTEGHCPGHQVVIVGEGDGALLFCADLIPTASHIRLPYIMAYDHHPMVTLEEKKLLLAQALEENWVLAFEHDPQIEACRLEEMDGSVIPGEPVNLELI